MLLRVEKKKSYDRDIVLWVHEGNRDLQKKKNYESNAIRNEDSMDMQKNTYGNF